MRRVDIKTGFLCNNNCLFCVQGHKKKYGNRSKEDIKKDLVAAKLNNCKGVVFTGGEVTIRDDVFELIRYAKQLGFKIIQIQSNGRRFSYKDFCKKIIGAGANQFALALHGHTAELHDSLTRSQGSFKQTTQAIKNLKELNQLILMNSVVVKQNYKYLPGLARLLVKLGVDQYQMAFVHPMGNAYKNYRQVIPKISEVAPYIHKALQVGIDSGVRVMAEAMPFCFMKGYEKYIAELIIPETEVRDIDKVVLNFNEVKRNEGKMKFPQCKLCKYDKICEGPWKEYPEKFGDSEFKPVKALPEEIKIELTNDCNLDCDFCFNDKTNKKELSKKQIFSLIDEVKKIGVKAIRFTGGEPFLRKDLRNILKYSKEKSLYTILNTNGVLIDDGNIDILRYVDDILVSVHDFKDFNGKKELFERLKRFNLTVRACTILTRENIKNLENYYIFFSKNPVDDWFLLRPVPNSKNKEPIDRGDVRKFTEKIIKLNRKYRVKGYVANSVPFCAYEPEMVKDICVGGRNDNGYTKLVVDAAGNIKTDYFSENVLGKIFKNKVIDVWGSRFLKRMRSYDLVPAKCRDCTYLGKCGGGLIFIDNVGLDPILSS